MLTINADRLMVLKGRPNSGVMSIPLTEIRLAESRIEEVATVTGHKAPELMSMFNRTYLDIDEIIRTIDLEVIYAKQNQSLVRSQILLDKVEEVFKQRGIKPSADLRQAVLDADPDYQSASMRVSALEAAREFFKGKQKGIEMAYSSVRKILGESMQSYAHRNTNLNGTVDWNAGIGND
jgi:hypothetical protein